MNSTEMARRVRALAGRESEYPLGEREWPDPLPLVGANMPPPFPIDALPTMLAEVMRAKADELQVPPDLVAMTALCTVAAIAGLHRVVVKPGWSEPCAIWAAVILPPGERKSAVMAWAKQPLDAIEKRFREDPARREARAVAEAAHDAAAGEVERLRATLKKAKGLDRDATEADLVKALLAKESLAPLPAEPRLTARDATPEAMVLRMAETGGRLGVFSAEGGVLSSLSGARYAETQCLDELLSAHAGDALIVDRVGRPTVRVDHPSLTLCIAAQPDVLLTMGSDRAQRGRGLLARFIWVVPTPMVGARNPHAAPAPCDETEWNARLDTIADALAFAPPKDFRLSPDARRTLLDFAAEIEPRLNPEADLALDGWGSKLCGFVARAALVLHLIDRGPDVDHIDAETVAGAITIGRWAAVHATIAFGQMGTTERETDARRILDKIDDACDSSGLITPRSTMRAVRTIDTADRAAKALDFLAEHGWIRPQQGNRNDARHYLRHPNLARFRDSRDRSLPSVTTVATTRPASDAEPQEPDLAVTTVTDFWAKGNATAPGVGDHAGDDHEGCADCESTLLGCPAHEESSTSDDGVDSL